MYIFVPYAIFWTIVLHHFHSLSTSINVHLTAFQMTISMKFLVTAILFWFLIRLNIRWYVAWVIGVLPVCPDHSIIPRNSEFSTVSFVPWIYAFKNMNYGHVCTSGWCLVRGRKAAWLRSTIRHCCQAPSNIRGCFLKTLFRLTTTCQELFLRPCLHHVTTFLHTPYETQYGYKYMHEYVTCRLQ